jgi:hypothetical protein
MRVVVKIDALLHSTEPAERVNSPLAQLSGYASDPYLERLHKHELAPLFFRRPEFVKFVSLFAALT